MHKSKAINNLPVQQYADEEEAREAVRTLIRWAGDDPDRPGLQDTPARVLQFYREFFSGYNAEPAHYINSIANDVTYDDFIMVKDIRLTSFCEHHMLPASGFAHIAYVPGKAVAGIGTIARIAADCARRLTTQEAITEEIASLMNESFAPKGVALSVSLNHGCMALRDAAQTGAQVVTTKFSGIFKDKPDIQNQFLTYIKPDQANA